MSTSAVEVSGEKVKEMWDKRLTEIFCDICIKEILKGNRPGEVTGLGWNLIKRTVDALDDWWESKLKVVPEAKKFRTSGIYLEFEGKLDQMFMGIVATSDKAWAPSSGVLRSDFFEDVNNEIPEENEEENVMRIVENSSGAESDNEREKKEILQRIECFNRLFVVASSSVQLYYEKYILKQPCMDSKQSGAIDGTHIAAILPPNEQIPYIGRKCILTQNVMAVCDFNMCFTFVVAGWEGSTHGTRMFLDVIRDSKYKFLHPPKGKYYLFDSGYPQMKCYLGPYRGQRYHLPDFRRGRPVSGKEEIFNHSHSSLRSVIERTFGVLKKMGHFKGYAKLKF
ncbi:hypothetical protein PVK06_024875 [Gossypium arboreum]|uniref:DDE Tnp4 domain-containing protein n=1 Tax=Gossypium arboreum TaxID=29729 RepID=A0ABR0PEV9_GOSAR|nr:hypothetical protein PVK06_024875 [Gossypium arboreum]